MNILVQRLSEFYEYWHISSLTEFRETPEISFPFPAPYSHGVFKMKIIKPEVMTKILAKFVESAGGPRPDLASKHFLA